MSAITLTLTPGLVRVLHAVFGTVLDGEQPVAQITLTSDDNQLIEIVLTGEANHGQ